MVRHNTEHVNGSHRWDGAADAFEELGEPWSTYGRLLIREDDARQAEQAAAVRQDLDGVARAGEERREAQEALEVFQQHHVTWMAQTIRWAVERNSAVITEILSPLFQEEFERIKAAVIECEDRLDRIEVRP
jgi:hypothetical protein